jgi:hypothetical protein
MAQAPRKPAKARASGKASKGSPSKSRGSAKAPAQSKSRAPTKQRAAPKRMPSSKSESRVSSATDQNWSGMIQALVTSTMGREVLADVLEAAAGALRKARADVQDAMAAGATAASAAGDTAVNVGTEMATGTVALVQTATEALADIVTGTAQTMLPALAGSETATPRRGGRGRKKAS